VEFAFLIQLVFELPDELAPVARAIRIVPAESESLDIDRSRQEQ
jgi:hypothetical protein